MFETNTYKKLKNMPQDNFPEKVFIHHSGGTKYDPLADTSHHTAKGIENQHLSMGWEGLGYNYVIPKNGDVWKGRPEHYHGAHAGPAWNKKSLGICLAGNFDVTLPTKEQEEALAFLLKDILNRYPNLAINDIEPHRKVANKSCYGKNLSDDWARNLVNPSSNKKELKAKILKHFEEIKKEMEKLKKYIESF